MSGSVTFSGSVHPVGKTARTAATTPRRSNQTGTAVRLRIMVVCLGSEGDGDAGEEVPRRRLRQEFRHREVVLPRLVELRVDAPVVGPRGQVAPRHREGQGARADSPRPLVRRHERDGYLAQLHEASVLDKTGFGRWGSDYRDRPRLVSQRRLGVVDRLADEELTAELLGVVQQLVAKPSVQQPGDAHAPRSEEHTSELQSLAYLVCRLLLE